MPSVSKKAKPCCAAADLACLLATKQVMRDKGLVALIMGMLRRADLFAMRAACRLFMEVCASGHFQKLLKGDVTFNNASVGELANSMQCLFGLIFLLYLVCLRFHEEGLAMYIDVDLIYLQLGECCNGEFLFRFSDRY